MAHDLQSLRRVAETARAIPGSMGLRQFRVYVVARDWSGEWTGDGYHGDDLVELLESGYPPRVRAMSGEEKAVNGFDSDAYKIGPFTPEWSSGGESGGIAFAAVKPEIEQQYTERHYLITGDGMGNGKRMALKSIEYDRSFRYMLVVQPIEAE